MNANEIANEGIVTQLAVVHTMLPKVKELIDQQQAEIERLIGAEPITYGMLTFCKNCGQQNPYQAKTLIDDPLVNFKPIWQEKPELTLTDEEIQEIAHGFEAIGWMGETTYEFARAILRKAQEK
jgi:hypothetical protein